MKIVDERLIFLGRRIREIRAEKGLSQQGLADLSHHSLRTIQRLEMGDENVTYTTIYDVVHCLQISADMIFYSDVPIGEKETQDFLNRMKPCSDWEKRFILNNITYMVEQFEELHSREKGERDLAGAGV